MVYIAKFREGGSVTDKKHNRAPLVRTVEMIATLKLSDSAKPKEIHSPHVEPDRLLIPVEMGEQHEVYNARCGNTPSNPAYAAGSSHFPPLSTMHTSSSTRAVKEVDVLVFSWHPDHGGKRHMRSDSAGKLHKTARRMRKMRKKVPRLLITNARSIFNKLDDLEALIQSEKYPDASISYLGILIQENLKWDQQVHKMVSSLKKCYHALKLLKLAGASKTHLVKAYNSFFRPRAEYEKNSLPTAGKLFKSKSGMATRIEKRPIKKNSNPRHGGHDLKSSRENDPVTGGEGGGGEANAPGKRTEEPVRFPNNSIDDSDTDSEDELDYQWKPTPRGVLMIVWVVLMIVLVFALLPCSSCFQFLFINPSSIVTYGTVRHFRGVHFSTEHFSQADRRNAIRNHHLKEKGIVRRLGLYSAAVHQFAEVPLVHQVNPGSLDPGDFGDSPREHEMLEKACKKVQDLVKELHGSGEVEPCLAKQPSRRKYASRLIEMVQVYVNSLKSLGSSMIAASTEQLPKRARDRTKEKWALLKDLKFTKSPFVSTSEDPMCALKFATCLTAWGKGSMSGLLMPSFLPNGRARHPYLGLVYRIQHTNLELKDGNSIRVLDLYAQNLVDVKYRYKGQRERIFIGGIHASHVQQAILIRVPNFRHPYRPFVEEKYRMKKEEYETFRRELEQYGPGGKMQDETAFHLTEKKILEFVLKAEEEKLRDQTYSCHHQRLMDWCEPHQFLPPSVHLDLPQLPDDAPTANSILAATVSKTYHWTSSEDAVHQKVEPSHTASVISSASLFSPRHEVNLTPEESCSNDMKKFDV
ncbi:unnamed protein product [Darwinula stevensoni]|uniref:Uncharacterized protein n=1 Tax=Darwinula stevensoni TaxID=69355 RepID=A0A7R9A824_9CRUS|nr:unnamed protein product [Darwinula stevensoni]CAG0894671.1 unnamed protein product [Darwinula stevensoni]